MFPGLLHLAHRLLHSIQWYRKDPINTAKYSTQFHLELTIVDRRRKHTFFVQQLTKQLALAMAEASAAATAAAAGADVPVAPPAPPPIPFLDLPGSLKGWLLVETVK